MSPSPQTSLHPTLGSISKQIPNSECFLMAASAPCYPFILDTASHLLDQLFVSVEISNCPVLLTHRFCFGFHNLSFQLGCMIDSFRWNHHLLICKGLDLKYSSAPMALDKSIQWMALFP